MSDSETGRLFGVFSKCPQSKGRNMMLKHLSHERLTQREMILAKCFDCMGGYIDGRIDCQMDNCPLYPVMPYREQS